MGQILYVQHIRQCKESISLWSNSKEELIEDVVSEEIWKGENRQTCSRVSGHSFTVLLSKAELASFTNQNHVNASLVKYMFVLLLPTPYLIVKTKMLGMTMSDKGLAW
jgi:hypothetical protein